MCSRYDGPDSVIEIDSDIAYAIALDSAANILKACSSSYDFVTVKYDSNGIQQWAGRYKGLDSTYDEVFALAADKFNNVYVTGYTSGLPGTFADYTTIKYDMNGTLRWVQVYNSGGGDDIARSIGFGSDDNISFNAIDYIAPNKIWAAGSNGLIYKSTDSGTNWVLQTRNITNENFNSVTFISENTGWAGGKLLFKTTNSGEDWIQQFDFAGNSVQSMCFHDESLGYVTG